MEDIRFAKRLKFEVLDRAGSEEVLITSEYTTPEGIRVPPRNIVVQMDAEDVGALYFALDQYMCAKYQKMAEERDNRAAMFMWLSNFEEEKEVSDGC